MANSKQLFRRRQGRTRQKLQGKSLLKPRLSVFRSGKHIYAQVIDDREKMTLASASTLEKEMRNKLETGGNVNAASFIGKTLAERALAKGVVEVVFDRGGYKFHGRVKALAEAAREGGLSF